MWLRNGLTMTRAPSQDTSPDMAEILAVAEQFEAARAAHPSEMARADLGDMLRLVPGKRAIFRGRFGERDCVWRMFLDPHGDAAAREMAELQRAWPDMQGKRFRICEPLFHAPAQRLIAVELVAGTPLLRRIRHNNTAEAEGFFRPAAQWLRRYTDSTESWTSARPLGWLKRAERAASTQPFGKLRKLEAPILTELTRLAHRIEGLEWRSAVCHGDFHPNNLISQYDRLTGIDTGGSGRMPIYKDMARFLMHMGRRGVVPSGRRVLGVDGAGLDAFTEVFALTEAERRLILPFMLGVEALIRVETPSLSDSRVRRARTMYAALLDDLVSC